VGAGGGLPSTDVCWLVPADAAGCGPGVIPSDRRSSSSWFGFRVGVAAGPVPAAAALPDGCATEHPAIADATRTSGSSARVDRR
jgi:hypothetical protein